jgi:AAA domain
MRLIRLWISDFKNLHDFVIEFEENAPSTVIVGKNGTGKSNFIEALVIIFRDLYLDREPSFNYKIEYLCSSCSISIDASSGRKTQMSIKVDNETISLRKLVNNKNPRYLPSHIFGYYSGISDRLERLFDLHQRKFYDQLLRGAPSILRPLFYARLIHSYFALLSFFTENDNDIKRFLEEYFRIVGLDYVLFILKKPDWKSNEGDARFWFARGTVQRFLDKLYKSALSPMKLSSDDLYLFIDATQFQSLANEYERQQDLFSELESTYISNLVARSVSF